LLTAVPLPDRPLTILWQTTLVDVEPGSRYGYRTDAAAVNSTLAIRNPTGVPVRFPLILATTDAEDRTPSHRSVRVADVAPALRPADEDVDWEALASAIRSAALAQGLAPERVEHYLVRLRASIRRAFKSEVVTLEPGEERFVRTYQRKLLPETEAGFEFRAICPLPQFVLAPGGTISVVVALPRATERFAVDLFDWTRTSASAFGKDPGLPPVAGRLLVSWLWREDPDLSVAYRYTEAPARVRGARVSTGVSPPSAR
jgi:hypothetical protein